MYAGAAMPLCIIPKINSIRIAAGQALMTRYLGLCFASPMLMAAGQKLFAQIAGAIWAMYLPAKSSQRKIQGIV